MAIQTNQTDKNQAYFITFTCYNFLPLIDMADSYQAFYRWFDYLKTKDVSILAYVIMPNHFHAIFFIPEDCDKSINQLISNGKRFIAYDIVNSLKSKKREELLQTMKDGITFRMANQGNKHRVFIHSFDCKSVFSEKMMVTKLDYIHNNPVSGKWNLVENYTEYKHSSAAFYELNQENDWVTFYEEVF